MLMKKQFPQNDQVIVLSCSDKGKRVLYVKRLLLIIAHKIFES
jgi:hypothetical protein